MNNNNRTQNQTKQKNVKQGGVGVSVNSKSQTTPLKPDQQTGLPQKKSKKVWIIIGILAIVILLVYLKWGANTTPPLKTPEPIGPAPPPPTGPTGPTQPTLALPPTVSGQLSAVFLTNNNASTLAYITDSTGKDINVLGGGLTILYFYSGTAWVAGSITSSSAFNVSINYADNTAGNVVMNSIAWNSLYVIQPNTSLWSGIDSLELIAPADSTEYDWIVVRVPAGVSGSVPSNVLVLNSAILDQDAKQWWQWPTSALFKDAIDSSSTSTVQTSSTAAQDLVMINTAAGLRIFIHSPLQNVVTN